LTSDRTPLLLVSLLALTIGIWSVAFVGIIWALEELSPLSLTLLRFLLASAGFAVVVAWRSARGHRMDLADRSLWLPLALIGLFGTVGYHVSLNIGEGLTGAGVASMIVALAPALTAVVAWVMRMERPSLVTAGGIALALAGVVIVSVLGRPGADLSMGSLAGPLILLVAPASWALNTTTVKSLAGRVDPIDMTAVSTWLGTAMLLPLVPRSFAADVLALSAGGWATVVFLALAATVFGYLAYNLAVTRFKATTVAASLYFVPLITVLVAAVVLDEPVTGWLLAAAAAIVAGVAVVDRGRARASRAAAARVG
jgi:drug/metabolite transporter (DMT)-like permease